MNTRPLPQFVIAITLFLAIASLHGRTSAQGPSDKNPQMLLAPWTDDSVAPKAEDYYSAAVRLYRMTLEAVEKYEAAVAAKKVKSLKLLEAGKTYVAINHLKRLATRLSGWGEPAGYDLQVRALGLAGRLEKVRNVMGEAFAGQIAANYSQLVARTAKQNKLVDQVTKMVNDGNFDAAEKKYLAPYAELAAMACWYNYQQRLATIHPFDVLDDKLAKAIEAENIEVAARTIEGLRDKTRPDLTKLPAALDAAAKQLAAGTDADFNGRKLTGPKLFIAAIKQWQDAHRAALRTIALHWALAAQRGQVARTDNLAQDYPEFRKNTITGLIKLIDTEADRATEAEVPTLHAAYLDLAAKLGSVTRDDGMMENFNAAIDKLAAKSPRVAADVAAYHGATDDWLRWQSRTGEVMAKVRRARAGALPIKAAESSLAPIELPSYVAQLKDQVIDRDFAMVGHFLGGSGDAPAVSAFSQYMYVRLKSIDLNEITKLESDLLVSPQNPPLSLAVAKTLASAKRGNFIEAGGVGSGVEVVGVIPFFATDAPERRGVIPLGEFGQLATAGFQDPEQHILISIELTPSWIRGDGFFVDAK